MKNHGKYKSPEYCAWTKMKERCYYKKANRYNLYGGRGIKVCKRWHSFKNFYEDMGNRPSEKYSIDRKDNSKDYSKANCRWATMKEQQNNRRNNRLMTFKGITLNVTQWEKKMGVLTGVFASRLFRGWSVERILTDQSQLTKTGRD